MKKLFNQLTVGDLVYVCNAGSMEYEQKEIYAVNRESVEILYTNIDRLDSSGVKKGSIIYFTSETDAIRYCKSNLIKTLNRLIYEVEKDIQIVKDFRNKHYDRLNLIWTDEQIDLLEKSLR